MMGGVLGFFSAVLIPLSSEVIRLEFTTSCRRDKGGAYDGGSGKGDTGDEWVSGGGGGRFQGGVCAFGLRKAGALMRVAEGMLVAMAVLVVGIGIVMFRWRTGVAAEPWSIASMAGLLSRGGSGGRLDGLLTELLVRDDYGRRLLLEGKRFRLGFYGEERACYGIIVEDVAEAETGRGRRPLSAGTAAERTPPWHVGSQAKQQSIVELLALTLTAGLLALILYYENTILDTPFEAFMDS